MTVKEYLRQAYLLDQRIKSDTMEYEELRMMSQTISSPGFEEHYNATKNTDAPYVRTLTKMMEMEDKLMEEVSQLLALKEQIREVVSQIDNVEYQMVLKLRYIHNMTWSAIAEELLADIRTVQRWHDKAVARVKLPENAIDIKSCRGLT